MATPYGAISLYGNYYYYNGGNDYLNSILKNQTNYLVNSDFSNGLSPWVVNNTAGDVLVNNGKLYTSTNVDEALYLVNPFDSVTQVVDPSVYDSVQTQNPGNQQAQWAICYDAKADPSDQFPNIKISAVESNQQHSSSTTTLITSQWGNYCSGGWTYGSSDTTIPGIQSVTITNIAQNSSGAAIGISLDNIVLKRMPYINEIDAPFTTISTVSAPLTLANTQTVGQLAATVTNQNVQFVTAAAVPTITATDVTVKKVTKKLKNKQKTKTVTVDAATKTVTVSDCVQTQITYGEDCCPSRSCDAIATPVINNNRFVPATTVNSTYYFATSTTFAFTVVTNAVTITVPITNTVQATQTVTLPGQEQPAVIKIKHQTRTTTITPAATVTKTVYNNAAQTATVYQCDGSKTKDVTCPSKARGAKALALFGKQSLKNANAKARKAGDPSVEIQCAGSETVYQC